MARQSSHRYCPCQTSGEMVRVPVPSVGLAGTWDWVSRPVAPFDGLRPFADTQDTYRHSHSTHTDTSIYYAHTHTHAIHTHTHTHTQVRHQPRRSRASIPSRKPVERQRRAECIPPLVWHERDIPVSQSVKGCGCRPLIRPQRQLLKATCDLVPPTTFWPCVFSSFPPPSPSFRLIALEPPETRDCLSPVRTTTTEVFCWGK